MTKNQKGVITVLWGVLVVMMVVMTVGFVTARKGADPATTAVETNDPHRPLQPLYDTPAFTLTNQDGKTVTSADLHGHPWVAAFFFTQCAGPCPMMSKKMSNLQELIAPKTVKLVSFTVDPLRDTPAVLKKYARQYHADDARWYFLTGTPEQMHQVAKGMKIAALSATPDQPIIHSTHFLLVNAQGQVCGIYDNTNPQMMQNLAADAAKLAAASAGDSHR